MGVLCSHPGLLPCRVAEHGLKMGESSSWDQEVQKHLQTFHSNFCAEKPVLVILFQLLIKVLHRESSSLCPGVLSESPVCPFH